jgi:hypothetical protein
MRQLSRPFGYTWVRERRDGEYRYELMQDLRSQLLEEELCNRDRNAALLALETEIERFRPYLHLSPDEAMAAAKTAPEAEKPLLERLAGAGWGTIQIDFRLSPRQLARLRAGEPLQFCGEPKPGEQPLASDLAHGVFQSWRDTRLVKEENGYSFVSAKSPALSGALPPAGVPESRAHVKVSLNQSELGQFMLSGSTGFGIAGTGMYRGGGSGPCAVGQSPAVLTPDNRSANQRLARHPSLLRRVSLQPRASCRPNPAKA